MSFLFLFFYFHYLFHQDCNTKKSFFPRAINIKFKIKKKVIMKDYVFHIVFLGKSKSSSLQCLGWKRQIFCKIKFLLIPEISKNKHVILFFLPLYKNNIDIIYFSFRKRALLKILYWKHLL